MTYPKAVANLIINTGRRYAKLYNCRVGELGVPSELLGAIANLMTDNIITANQGHRLYEFFIKGKKDEN